MNKTGRGQARRHTGWGESAPNPDVKAAEAVEAAVAASRSAGRSLRRAVLAACPGLGPVLAGELDGSAPAFSALVARLLEPRPTLIVPAAPGAVPPSGYGVGE